jgi:hypothetical protein
VALILDVIYLRREQVWSNQDCRDGRGKEERRQSDLGQRAVNHPKCSPALAGFILKQFRFSAGLMI